MDSGLKVTDQQQEISFSDIVSGDNVINIPLFQRAYRWGAPNLKELWDDVGDIIEEKSKSQFLGVLVLVSQTGKSGGRTFLMWSTGSNACPLATSLFLVWRTFLPGMGMALGLLK